MYLSRERETADKCISKSSASHLKIEIKIVRKPKSFQVVHRKSQAVPNI